MHFFRDSGVSSVLESSFTPRKLRLSGRCFLALTQKLLFLEVPLTGTQRQGLLTQGAVLLLTGSSRGTAFIKRGIYTLDNLLFDAPPAPPPNIDQSAAPAERFADWQNTGTLNPSTQNSTAHTGTQWAPRHSRPYQHHRGAVN